MPIASAVGLAPVATADTSDDTFLGRVRSTNNAGLTKLTYSAPDVVIKAGRNICTMLDRGYGVQAVWPDPDRLIRGVRSIA